MAVTDSSQALQDQYTYDPYGNTSDSGGSSANPFQFTGRENDGNGLYYMRGRYYAPAIGRFISRDPAGFAGGFNLYEYAGDDPVDFSDPTGDWVAIGPGLGCGGDCYGAWSGPDSIAIPHGFVGVPSISQLAPIPNINGFDIQQGRQTNGGLLIAGGRDKWYGYQNKTFQKWYHRHRKEPGAADASKKELDEAHKYWSENGQPDAEGHRTDQPNPTPNSNDTPTTDEDDDDYSHKSMPFNPSSPGVFPWTVPNPLPIP